MKKFWLISIICLLLVASSGAVFAGNPSKTGSAGALELLIPVGARGVALGGSSLSLIGGVDAIHWNPAGLAKGWGSTSVDAMFSHSDYLASTSVDYAAIGVNLGDLGVLALSLRSFGFGNIDETSELYPDGNGVTFSPTYVTVGLSYAKSLTDRIHLGFTTKYVSEKIVNTGASGIALDVGVLYNVGGTGPLRGLHFGVALKNIGPNMQYTGRDLERTVVPPNSAPGAVGSPLSFAAQDFELPASFEFGVGYDYMPISDYRLSPLVTFDNVNFGNDQYKAGVEFAFKEMFFLRGGYTAVDGSKDNYVFGGTFGAGFAYDLGAFGIEIDYAYMTAKVFNGVNVLSLRLKM